MLQRFRLICTHGILSRRIVLLRVTSATDQTPKEKVFFIFPLFVMFAHYFRKERENMTTASFLLARELRKEGRHQKHSWHLLLSTPMFIFFLGVILSSPVLVVVQEDSNNVAALDLVLGQFAANKAAGSFVVTEHLADPLLVDSSSAQPNAFVSVSDGNHPAQQQQQSSSIITSPQSFAEVSTPAEWATWFSQVAAPSLYNNVVCETSSALANQQLPSSVSCFTKSVQAAALSEASSLVFVGGARVSLVRSVVVSSANDDATAALLRELLTPLSDAVDGADAHLAVQNLSMCYSEDDIRRVFRLASSPSSTSTATTSAVPFPSRNSRYEESEETQVWSIDFPSLLTPPTAAAAATAASSSSLSGGLLCPSVMNFSCAKSFDKNAEIVKRASALSLLLDHCGWLKPFLSSSTTTSSSSSSSAAPEAISLEFPLYSLASGSFHLIKFVSHLPTDSGGAGGLRWTNEVSCRSLPVGALAAQSSQAVGLCVMLLLFALLGLGVRAAFHIFLIFSHPNCSCCCRSSSNTTPRAAVSKVSLVTDLLIVVLIFAITIVTQLVVSEAAAIESSPQQQQPYNNHNYYYWDSLDELYKKTQTQRHIAAILCLVMPLRLLSLMKIGPVEEQLLGDAFNDDDGTNLDSDDTIRTVDRENKTRNNSESSSSSSISASSRALVVLVILLSCTFGVVIFAAAGYVLFSGTSLESFSSFGHSIAAVFWIMTVGAPNPSSAEPGHQRLIDDSSYENIRNRNLIDAPSSDGGGFLYGFYYWAVIIVLRLVMLYGLTIAAISLFVFERSRQHQQGAAAEKAAETTSSSSSSSARTWFKRSILSRIIIFFGTCVLSQEYWRRLWWHDVRVLMRRRRWCCCCWFDCGGTSSQQREVESEDRDGTTAPSAASAFVSCDEVTSRQRWKKTVRAMTTQKAGSNRNVINEEGQCDLSARDAVVVDDDDAEDFSFYVHEIMEMLAADIVEGCNNNNNNKSTSEDDCSVDTAVFPPYAADMVSPVVWEMLLKRVTEEQQQQRLDSSGGGDDRDDAADQREQETEEEDEFVLENFVAKTMREKLQFTLS